MLSEGGTKEYYFPGHNSGHMQITPIEKVFNKNKDALKLRESEWIKEFGTLVPRGMNIKSWIIYLSVNVKCSRIFALSSLLPNTYIYVNDLLFLQINISYTALLFGPVFIFLWNGRKWQYTYLLSNLYYSSFVAFSYDWTILIWYNCWVYAVHSTDMTLSWVI